MAIYRFEAKIISRNGERSTVASASYRTGKCATSAAAYRAGATLTDERTGQRYDYTNKRGVMGAEIILPAGAPAWMKDRSQLWNAIEKIEKRKDAQLARDFILSLPHELSHAQRVALTQEFVREQFANKGYVADIAWHSPHKGDSLNHHAHVMVTMRKVEGDGFARLKERPAPGVHPAKAWKDELGRLRQAWEDTANKHLAAAGLEVRIDCRSNEAQGNGRVPEPKMGSLAAVIERDGRESLAGHDMREIRQHNAEVKALKVEHAKAEAEIIDLQLHRLRKSGMDDDATKEASTRQQPGKVVEAVDQLRAEEERARATLRREAEGTAQRAEALKSTAQREAEKAAKEREEHVRAEERRAHEGAISSAESRYAIALGENYDIRDPYGSLARAAMSEGAQFQRQQMQLGKELSEAKTPEQRYEISLRKEIEANEYMGLTSHRIAGINEAIGGEGHKRSAILEHTRGDVFDQRAKELRDERAAFLALPEQQRRAEMAEKLGSLAQQVEKGTFREDDKRGQADGRNQKDSAETRPTQQDAAATAGRPREERDAASTRAGGKDYSHLSEEKQAALAAMREGFAQTDQRNREAGQSRSKGRGR